MKYTREQIEVAAQNAAECGPVQQAIIRQLLAENDALREDAERYRWLKNKGRYNDFCVEQDTPGWRKTHSSSTLDAAIDAARKKD